MLKGKIVSLEILKSDDESLKYYLDVSREKINVQNLSDHFLDVTPDDIRDSFVGNYDSEETTNFLFAIVLGKMKVGLLYILRDVEKRTAEIQLMLSEEKYRYFGLGFDAIYAAVKFCKEELNLHSITFKYASHNNQMSKAFKFSQYKYDQKGKDFAKEEGIPDVCYRQEFFSNGKRSDFYGYTFILDSDVQIEDFLNLASGKHSKYIDEKGNVCL